MRLTFQDIRIFGFIRIRCVNITSWVILERCLKKSKKKCGETLVFPLSSERKSEVFNLRRKFCAARSKDQRTVIIARFDEENTGDLTEKWAHFHYSQCEFHMLQHRNLADFWIFGPIHIRNNQECVRICEISTTTEHFFRCFQKPERHEHFTAFLKKDRF